MFFLGPQCSVIFAVFGVRRLHDLGVSGWRIAVVIFPFMLAYIPAFFPMLYVQPLLARIMFGMCAFFPGRESENRFGLPGSGSPFEIERFEGPQVASS